MTRNLFAKVIEKDSRLDDVSSGDLVEILGISSADQKVRGRVLYSDLNANLILIAIRNREDIIEISYFITPYGVKEGSEKKLCGPGNPEYVGLNKKLLEVGL